MKILVTAFVALTIFCCACGGGNEGDFGPELPFPDQGFIQRDTIFNPTGNYIFFHEDYRITLSTQAGVDCYYGTWRATQDSVWIKDNDFPELEIARGWRREDNHIIITNGSDEYPMFYTSDRPDCP